jgi:formate hydrogenlyase subunit 6/NADH:ubiquinone oxidoreductase subunit I
MKAGKMMTEVLKHLARKPATVLYPFERPAMPDGFRGRIMHNDELCGGCRLCERDCPAFAITVEKVGEKRYVVSIDVSRCIFCAQCVESCPKKALAVSAEYELAEIDPIISRMTIERLL